jgi:hypothetical protein
MAIFYRYVLPIILIFFVNMLFRFMDDNGIDGNTQALIVVMFAVILPIIYWRVGKKMFD